MNKPLLQHLYRYTENTTLRAKILLLNKIVVAGISYSSPTKTSVLYPMQNCRLFFTLSSKHESNRHNSSRTYMYNYSVNVSSLLSPLIKLVVINSSRSTVWICKTSDTQEWVGSIQTVNRNMGLLAEGDKFHTHPELVALANKIT